MPRPATIDDYRWLYANNYMVDGLKCARDIAFDIVDRCPATFLDYGGGRGDLCRWINRHTRGIACWWDPAFGIGLTPDDASVDYVIACDVLEHVPVTDLAQTLKDIARLATRGALLTIANMSDVHRVNGDDVELHLIQQPPEWWAAQLTQAWPRAKVAQRTINIHRFSFIVEIP